MSRSLTLDLHTSAVAIRGRDDWRRCVVRQGRIRMGRVGGWMSQRGTIRGVSRPTSDVKSTHDAGDRFFQTVASVVPDMILVVDLRTERVHWTNRSRDRRFAHHLGRITSLRSVRKALHRDDQMRLDAIMARLRSTVSDRPPTVEERFRAMDGDGQWRWLSVWIAPWLDSTQATTELRYVVCSVRDIDAAVRIEQRLQWEAGHDPLTGLANRRVINEMLQRASADRSGSRWSVYFIDLDDFKKVNDALGHAAGDELLRTLAERISSVVGPRDVVGRFGGDELIIVSSLASDQLADRVLAVVRRPAMLGGAELTVTCSVGIALLAPGDDPDEVVHRANEAMYSAKRSGRDRWEIAGPLNTGPAQRRVHLEADLRRAVQSGSEDLQLVFQPIVDRAREPVAAEALLRWNHPTRGPMVPSQFLSIAEDAGLMIQLGDLIIRRSLAAAAEWMQAARPMMVAVNVGRQQLGNGQLEKLIRQALEETGTGPDQLCLEVTESVLVDADSPELAELWRLRELGLEIALDDFGTGYAPLTHLKRLPATILKLDRSFVAGIGSPIPNPTDVAVARALGLLAGELGLRVIAEGVESEQQFEQLSELGYELFQGFWAHPPMPNAHLHELLVRR